MSSKHLLFGVLVLASVSSLTVVAQQNSTPAAAPSNKSASQKHVTQTQDDGERAFQQNCSRCHTAPDGFSSRISGTVVRHMRVRASLSRDDEKALLRFFNP